MRCPPWHLQSPAPSRSRRPDQTESWFQGSSTCRRVARQCSRGVRWRSRNAVAREYQSPKHYTGANKRNGLVGFLMKLANVNFVEAEALQHAGDCAARVVGGVFQDAVLQGSLLKLALCHLADFAFKVGIRRREQPGVARIYLRPRVVDSRAKDFSR